MLILLQMCLEEFEFSNFNAIEESLLGDLVHVKHCAEDLENTVKERSEPLLSRLLILLVSLLSPRIQSCCICAM